MTNIVQFPGAKAPAIPTQHEIIGDQIAALDTFMIEVISEIGEAYETHAEGEFWDVVPLALGWYQLMQGLKIDPNTTAMHNIMLEVLEQSDMEIDFDAITYEVQHADD